MGLADRLRYEATVRDWEDIEVLFEIADEIERLENDLDESNDRVVKMNREC